jgi:SAM-dependent methyltransferase
MWRAKWRQLLGSKKSRRTRDLSDRVSQEFFESRYQQSEDPWKFATSAYELNRYRAILAALSDRRFLRAFEPGCSIGVLTEQLADRCTEVQALDISPTAVAKAQARCGHLAHVHIRHGALPSVLPDGDFDLIIFSEIGYYFHREPLRDLVNELLHRLRPYGVFLASHWTGKSADHLLSGDEVHDLIRGTPGISLTLEQRKPEFLLGRWSRSSA